MTRGPNRGGARRHRPRARPDVRPSRTGERHELECGPVAHGGHVVARLPEGTVVFVRHALPGERVVVEVTEGREGDRFLRGDAVEVLTASEHRVPAPCPYAGPGLCGGCDFQHAQPAYQRKLKTAVVREQLARLAGIVSGPGADVVVEEVDPLLAWRTRMQYVELPGGRRGLHRHRSSDVIEIDTCLIDAGPVTPVVDEGRSPVSGPPQGPRPPDFEVVETTAGPHTFEVEPDGFWQPHVAAPRVLVETVLEMLDARPGETAVDLYAGVGLFATYLADAVGDEGLVTAVEGDRRAAAHAAENAGTSVQADVQAWLESPAGQASYDLVVLDPPRTGAKRRVVEGIVAERPRAVAYVACDPAALARDVAIFAEHGYTMSALRAFDLFPMTHHVECVALLEKTTTELR